MADTIAGSLVREYIEAHSTDGTLKFSKSAIARKLATDHPLIFRSKDVARQAIGYYTGSKGVIHRKYAINPLKVDNTFSRENPFGIPPSEADDSKPYVFDRVRRRVGMISDLQYPYHDERAVYTALNHLKKVGIDTLYINGDFFDFYQGSRFMNDPRKRNLAGEILQGKEFLHEIFRAFKNCNFYFKEGNHEVRWKRYLMINAPQLLDMPEFELETILELGKFGCHFIKDKQFVEMGKLNVLHGHEIGCGTVYPARGLFNKIRDNGIIGHHHQITHFSPKGLRHSYGAWSTGCLCHLSPDFSRHNEWKHGFAVIELEGNGEFNVRNHEIIKGKVY